MTYLEGSIPFTIAAARRILANQNCFSFAQGHVSARGDDGDSFWMTPWQYQDETLPEHVVHLGFDFQRRGGADLTVGPASQFHKAIYEARPDINSIIHTHSFYVQVISTTDRCVDSFVGEACIIHGAQAFCDLENDFHKEGSHPLAAALGDKHILILKNHGSITTGSCIQDATVRALMLEHCARVQVEAEKIGGKPMVPEDVYIRDFWTEAGTSLWNSNFRRLARTDPDLREIVGSTGPAVPRRPGMQRRENPIVKGRGFSPLSNESSDTAQVD
jgi:L-fuculose-phosphate aldolase